MADEEAFHDYIKPLLYRITQGVNNEELVSMATDIKRVITLANYDLRRQISAIDALVLHYAPRSDWKPGWPVVEQQGGEQQP